MFCSLTLEGIRGRTLVGREAVSGHVLGGAESGCEVEGGWMWSGRSSEWH